MAQPGGPGKPGGALSADIFKATQDIAAQAALRAQERLQKVREPPPIPGSEVPVIPARSSGIFQKAPDIPPKKFATNNNNVPPPLPQKPQQRSNINDNPVASNSLYAQTAAVPLPAAPVEIPKRLDYLPQVPSRNSNPLEKPNPVKNGQLEFQKQVPGTKPGVAPANATKLSPMEDTSSEDALRGIESGLRNMERAMQEQLSLRSMESETGQQMFMPEFRAGLRNIGSLNSFEGLTPPQYMMPGSNNNNPVVSGRPLGMERGMSMDQMRMDSQLRSLESNPNIRAVAEDLKMKPQSADVTNGGGKVGGGGGGGGRPIEQHMRSLDRSLPLELQYSRNHRQQQLQQQQLLLQQHLVSKVMSTADPNRHLDMLNQFISRGAPNPAGMVPLNPGQPPNMMGRTDDMKLRRRSSHDENQMMQNATAVPPGRSLD